MTLGDLLHTLFDLRFTLYMLPVLAAAAVSGVLAAYARRRLGVPGAPGFCLFMLASVAWCLAYAFELGGADLPTLLLWEKISYLGVVFSPLAWLVFALQYTGEQRWLRRRLAPLALLLPLVTLYLVWTNEDHGLVWSRVTLNLTGPFMTLNVVRGPWFWAHTAYAGAAMLGGALLLLWTLARSPDLYRQQSGAMIVAALAPWVANVLQLTGLSPVPRLDITPFALTFSGAVCGWALFRARLFDIVPVARDALIEGMRDGVIVLDTQGRIVDLNPAARRVIGAHAAGALGQPVAGVFPSWPANLSAHTYAAEAQGELTLGSGFARREFDLVVSPLRSQHGTLAGRLVVLRDITEHKRSERALQHQSLHDALTELPNRAHLLESLKHALWLNAREGRPIGLLMLDLDGFKEVNDTFGHLYGDKLLQHVGQRLRGVLRGADTISRLGGDEFAILLLGANTTGAIVAACRFMEALDQPFVIDGFRFHVAASIGIAVCPDHGQDPHVLLRRADIAMYVAKRAQSGYAVYSYDEDQHSVSRLSLMGELRSAIEQGELLLHYQPQLDLKTGRFVRAEALVRWQHAQRGLIPPDRFVPIAEQSGLIHPLSLWVVRTALQQCGEWHREGIDAAVAVNLSMRNLHDHELPATIESLLAASRAKPAWLNVEITEGALMADPTKALAVLTQLREMGVRIAVDDFGSGFSSLSYLKRLPLDELKIDKTFVLNMAKDDHDAAIVHSTITLAHDLGLEVTAEGVEDRATWDLLDCLDCDVAQGYYISRPMPARDLTRWVQERQPKSDDGIVHLERRLAGA